VVTTAPVSIFVLSEDSRETPVREIIRRTLFLIDPHCRTRDTDKGRVRELIRLLPLKEGALRGTSWKSTDAASYTWRIDLIRTIATALCEPDTFVCFHIDGDRAWADRDESENVRKFNDIVLTAVRQQLAHHGRSQEALDRFFLVDPFYSIEAWLYQNLNEALRLCREHHRGEHVGRFEAWRLERRALDEIPGIKDSTCLGSTYNTDLAANGFPADEVFGVFKSYARVVERMLGCAALTDALARTRAV
jgi:hypothetical protein